MASQRRLWRELFFHEYFPANVLSKLCFISEDPLGLLLNEMGYQHCDVCRLNIVADKILLRVLGLCKFLHLFVDELVGTSGEEGFNICWFSNLVDRCKKIVLGTLLSFLRESWGHLLASVVDSSPQPVFLVFARGFSNHTANVVVGRSGVARLTSLFVSWYLFFFFNTIMLWFVFYVIIHGVFGQYVKVILQ